MLFPRFAFIPKTDIGLPKTGFGFYEPLMNCIERIIGKKTGVDIDPTCIRET